MNDTTNPWIWEFSTLDGATVYDTTEYWDLDALKAAVDASFTDYTWEEVERRGIFGTSVLVEQGGRWVDTGHWVYRKPKTVPTAMPGRAVCSVCDREMRVLKDGTIGVHNWRPRGIYDGRSNRCSGWGKPPKES